MRKERYEKVSMDNLFFSVFSSFFDFEKNKNTKIAQITKH